MNQVSGPIPQEIGNLVNSTKIYLQFNELTGKVPLELDNLRNFVDHQLDRNKLEGTIPRNCNSSFTSNINGKKIKRRWLMSLESKYSDHSKKHSYGHAFLNRDGVEVFKHTKAGIHTF